MFGILGISVQNIIILYVECELDYDDGCLVVVYLYTHEYLGIICFLQQWLCFHITGILGPLVKLYLR